jgi:hypothetical protein
MRFRFRELSRVAAIHGRASRPGAVAKRESDAGHFGTLYQMKNFIKFSRPFLPFQLDHRPHNFVML